MIYILRRVIAKRWVKVEFRENSQADNFAKAI